MRCAIFATANFAYSSTPIRGAVKEAFDDAVAALKKANVPLKRAVAMGSKEETAQLLREEIAEWRTFGNSWVAAMARYRVAPMCWPERQTAMAVLPLGTGNTWAHSLGLPLDLEEAAQVIAKGHIESSDVGRVNGRVFLNSVALGLSCEIAQSLDKNTKKKLGLLAWPVVGARVLWHHKALQIKVTSHERTYRVRTHQIWSPTDATWPGRLPPRPTPRFKTPF